MLDLPSPAASRWHVRKIERLGMIVVLGVGIGGCSPDYAIDRTTASAASGVSTSASGAGGSGPGGAPGTGGTTSMSSGGGGGASSSSIVSSAVSTSASSGVGGGDCTPCGLEQRCESGADCASNACDESSKTCVASQCIDHRQDGNETDVDCGGSNTCLRCQNGAGCIVDSDCIDVCNVVTHRCVANHCADGHQDFGESDVDCGAICNGCMAGQKCTRLADCRIGLQCDLSTMTCRP
jgi:hypothetical protein